MSDFGTDVQTFPDLDPAFSPLTGNRVLVEAVAKRLSTPAGALEYAPEYGLDVRSFLNGGFTAARVSDVAAQIQNEVVKDERVLSAKVSVALDSQAQSMKITLVVVADTGPFTLVLNVTALSLTLL